jgi:hypothetical protein
MFPNDREMTKKIEIKNVTALKLNIQTTETRQIIIYAVKNKNNINRYTSPRQQCEIKHFL